MTALDFDRGYYNGYVGQTRPTIWFDDCGYRVGFVASTNFFNAPSIAKVEYWIIQGEDVVLSAMPLAEAEARAADLLAMGFKKTVVAGAA